MNSLLTPEQIKSYKDIGKKIDEDKMNPIISQAQEVDLKDYLGMNFYFDVLANIDNPAYQDLISGGTFTIGTVTYYQEGLKAMLADLFMSRFVLQINTNITPFGATTKVDQNSEPTDRNILKDIAQFNKEMAGSKWEIIKMYLDANKALFPNYNACRDTVATGERRLRFRKI